MRLSSQIQNLVTKSQMKNIQHQQPIYSGPGKKLTDPKIFNDCKVFLPDNQYTQQYQHSQSGNSLINLDT